jgi:hypothetical protein
MVSIDRHHLGGGIAFDGGEVGFRKGIFLSSAAYNIPCHDIVNG